MPESDGNLWFTPIFLYLGQGHTSLLYVALFYAFIPGKACFPTQFVCIYFKFSLIYPSKNILRLVCDVPLKKAIVEFLSGFN